MSRSDRAPNFDDMWIKLSEGIEHVYRGSEKLSRKAQLELYTLIYNYFTNTPGPRIGGNNRPINVQDGANVVGAELYAKLKNYLKTYLEEIVEEGVDLQGEDLLHFYTTNWKRYRFSSEVTNSICSYFNRHWVQRQYHSGRRNVYEVYLMAMEVWQLIFFQALYRQLTLACLQLIRAERNNEVINTQLISGVIESYIEIDLTAKQWFLADRNQIKSPPLTIYKDHFELKFLEDTAQFYRDEAATFLAQNSVTEYLKKVAQRLDEEEHRIQSYLHPSTTNALIEKVEEVLILDRLEAIFTEAKVLLHNERHQDMALLFKLVSRLPNATLELEKIVGDHIHQMGIDAIGRVSGTALNDPKLYVETILDIYTKSFKLVEEVFNNEPNFSAVLDKACVEFINNNAVTAVAGSPTKSSELLAQYRDTFLREGSNAIETMDLEEKFNQIIALISKSTAAGGLES